MSKAKKGKRFVYSLESLLKVREIRERQEQEVYNELEQTYLKEKEREETLKAEQQAQYQELLGLMSSKEPITDLTEITRRKAHLDILKVKVEEQVKVREEAETKKDEQREKLIQAVKERKIIEKDKEKTREAWRKLMDKEAGKFLDDIATVGFERQRVEAKRLASEESGP